MSSTTIEPCARCAVCTECREYDLADPELNATWAGTSHRERRHLRQGLVPTS